MSVTGFSSKFKTHLGKFNTSPYLFIGSGMSRRYLQLPTWSLLLEEFSKELELPFQFGYYASQVGNDLPQLASNLANEFHKTWWTSEKFKENREKWKDEAQINAQQPFKIELTEFIIQKTKIDLKYNDEVDLLKRAVIDGIITTNWDDFTFNLLEGFETFIGQNKLLFADSTSIGEIYKIHGCVTKPESLVVTKEDYESFERRNQFLAAKLFTIFVEHPIIFLGYSISDENIINILSSIVGCLDNENIDKLRERLIFVEWSEDQEEPQISDGQLIINRLPLPIKHIRLNSFIPLFSVLEGLKQRLPIKVLRRCKNAVYDLVKTKSSVNTILVGDIENIKEGEELEFVIGVGVANQYSDIGYIGISNSDIFEDIVLNNKGWDASIVIKDVIPKLFKGKAYLPLYKYLRQNGDLDDDGLLQNNGNYNDKIRGAIDRNEQKVYFPNGITYLKKKDIIKNSIKSFKQLTEEYEIKHVLLYISFIDLDNIELDMFLEFLKQNIETKIANTTDFRRLICYYDYLKYGLQLGQKKA